MDVACLRSTFAQIAPDADAVAKAFYDRMFRVYPQVKPLFKNTEPANQRKKLMASLGAIVNLADDPGELSPLLEQLGRSHAAYQVEPQHYPFVAASLMATLAEAFGEAWTPAAADTWSTALGVVSEAMIAAQARAVA